jgi:hypothetical protein
MRFPLQSLHQDVHKRETQSPLSQVLSGLGPLRLETGCELTGPVCVPSKQKKSVKLICKKDAQLALQQENILNKQTEGSVGIVDFKYISSPRIFYEIASR